jgi:membrane fusion protein, multidrug efflux system
VHNKRLIQCLLLHGAFGVVLACFLACSHSTDPGPQAAPARASSVKVPVSVATAGRRDLVRKITLPGTLVALNEATLYGKVAGYVKSISVDKGDRVRHGQTLAVLEAPEMVKEVDQAQASYREALASLNRAKAEANLQAATYARYREVHGKDPDAVSKQELDEYRSKSEVADADVKLAEARVETARANHDRLVALSQYAFIAAPFGGVVTSRYVDPGALIQAATSSTQGQPIATVQDLDTVRVYVSVAEIDVPFIHVGTPASLTTAAYPGKIFNAAVTRFAEALDSSTRTMKSEIDVRNPQHALRPGMYADVTLDIERLPNVLITPDSALVVEGSKKFVWVVRDGLAHKVQIETGRDDGTQMEIRSGLTGGEELVVAGKDGLAEGRAVQASGLSTSKP